MRLRKITAMTLIASFLTSPIGGCKLIAFASRSDDPLASAESDQLSIPVTVAPNSAETTSSDDKDELTGKNYYATPVISFREGNEGVDKGQIASPDSSASKSSSDSNESIDLSLCGFISINNANPNCDYKQDLEDFKRTVKHANTTATVKEIYCPTSNTRNLAGESIAKSYLIRNNILSREKTILYTDSKDHVGEKSTRPGAVELYGSDSTNLPLGSASSEVDYSNSNYYWINWFKYYTENDKEFIPNKSAGLGNSVSEDQSGNSHIYVSHNRVYKADGNYFIKDEDDSVDLANKSDLYMMLYKTYYGVLESNTAYYYRDCSRSIIDCVLNKDAKDGVYLNYPLALDVQTVKATTTSQSEASSSSTSTSQSASDASSTVTTNNSTTVTNTTVGGDSDGSGDFSDSSVYSAEGKNSSAKESISVTRPSESGNSSISYEFSGDESVIDGNSGVQSYVDGKYNEGYVEDYEVQAPSGVTPNRPLTDEEYEQIFGDVSAGSSLGGMSTGEVNGTHSVQTVGNPVVQAIGSASNPSVVANGSAISVEPHGHSIKGESASDSGSYYEGASVSATGSKDSAAAGNVVDKAESGGNVSNSSSKSDSLGEVDGSSGSKASATKGSTSVTDSKKSSSTSSASEREQVGVNAYTEGAEYHSESLSGTEVSDGGGSSTTTTSNTTVTGSNSTTSTSQSEASSESGTENETEATAIVTNIATADSDTLDVDKIQYYNVLGKGDYWCYTNPNVYELYLQDLVAKGYVKRKNVSDDEGCAGYYFKRDLKRLSKNVNGTETYDTQRVSVKSVPWARTAAYDRGNPSPEGVVWNDRVFGYSYVTQFDYRNYVGDDNTSVYRQPAGIYFMRSLDPTYFNQEHMTMMQALKIVDKFVKDNEDSMTDTEESIIKYKYGIDYLNDFSKENQKVIMHLIALGILNFEDKDSFVNLKAYITNEQMYELLYRVANKEARFDFSVIQLTDSDTYWNERGFGSSTFEVYEDQDVPAFNLEAEKVAGIEDTSVPLDLMEGGVSGVADITTNTFFQSRKESKADSSYYLLQKRAPAVASYSTPSTQTIYGDKYKVAVVMEPKYKYTYDGVELKLTTTNKEIEDLYHVVEMKEYDHNYFMATFLIVADSKSLALDHVQSKLRIEGVSKNTTSLKGVTKVIKDKHTVTLISRKYIDENIKYIKTLNSNTLVNTKTGTKAVLLPEQRCAMVGNRIFISDEILETDHLGEVHYNLEMICILMKNATLRKINGAEALVCQEITDENEKPFKVVSNRNGSVVETNYCVKFTEQTGSVASSSSDGDSGDSGDKNGDGKVTQWYFNLDTMQLSRSFLTRQFIINTVRNKKEVSIPVDVIVEFKYVVPDDTIYENFVTPSSSETEESLHQKLTKEGAMTFRSATEMLYTRPSAKGLQHWWDMNLAMSNALCNFMYDTQGETFITCGYVSPKVTILAHKAGSQEKEEKNGTVVLSKDGLSLKELNVLFSSLKLTDSSMSQIFGAEILSSASSWFNYYYNDVKKSNRVGNYTRSAVALSNALVSNVGFSSLGPSNKINLGNTVYFGKYVVTNNCIYKKLNSDYSRIDSSKRKIITKLTSNSNTVIPRVGDTFKIHGTAFKIVDEVEIGNGEYYVVTLKNANQFKINGYVDDKTAFSEMVLNSNGKSLKQFYSTMDKKLIRNQDASHTDVFQSVLKDRTLMTRIYDDSKLRLVEDAYYVEYTDKGRKYYQCKDGNLKTVPKSKAGSKKAYVVTNYYLNKKDFYFTGSTLKNYSLDLHQGNVIGILNCRKLLQSVSSTVIDSIYYKSLSAISVENLAEGSKLLVGDVELIKQADGSFVTDLLATNSVTGLPSNGNSYKNAKKRRSSLMQAFSEVMVNTDGKNRHFSAFVSSIDVGTRSVSLEQGVVLYKKNGAYYARDGEVENNNLDQTIGYVSIQCSLEKELVCVPNHQFDNTFVLLSKAAGIPNSSIGLDGLSFYPEISATSRNERFLNYYQASFFTLSEFANSVKEKFYSEYEAAKQGDVKMLFKYFLYTIIAYLMAMTLVFFTLLQNEIMITTLQELAMPMASGRNRGFDVVKILTLGVFNVSDRPRLSRILVLDFVFAIILFAIFRYL